MAPRRWYVQIACFLLLLFPRVGGADCPEVTISVDNDIPGSGYSEVNPENWLSRPVGSCSGNYRYLSHTVGDGTRTGKAIWQPAIPHNGWYRIVTSYRATENRTNDADYYVYDDEGGVTHTVINQAHSGDCTYVELGDFYCVVGGDCRLELDGTDDSLSDAADITTFELVDCDDPTPSNCTGIATHPDYELCNETSSTCAGVYNNSDGCITFCAAAGMECVARYGGEPGCQKEPDNAIPCDEVNNHTSDWCECAYPAGLDGGIGDGAVHTDGGTDTDGSAFDGATDGGLASDATTSVDANNQAQDGQPPDAEYYGTPCGGGFMSGCGCRTLGGPISSSSPSSPLLWFLLILLCVVGYRCFCRNNGNA